MIRKIDVMKEKKNVFIGIKIQPTLSQMIKEDAQNSGRSVSNWLQEMAIVYFQKKGKME